MKNNDLLETIDKLITNLDNINYIFKDKLEYINNFNDTLKNVINYKLGDLIEFYLYIMSPNCSENIEKLNYIKDNLNSYEMSNDMFILLYNLMQNNINVDFSNDLYEELNKIKITEDSKQIIRNIFVRYNSKETLYFFSLFNGTNKKLLIVFIEEVITLKNNISFLCSNIDKAKKNKMSDLIFDKIKLVPKVFAVIEKEKVKLNSDSKEFNKKKIISKKPYVILRI